MTSDTHAFLGMPLDAALAAARRQGLPEPEIVRTAAPRRRDDPDAGTLRVVRVQGMRWTVSAFQDARPKE